MDIDKVIKRLRDDDEYYGEFGKQFFSNSDMKTLITNPDKFKHPSEQTIAMIKGGLFHTAILEPHKVETNFPAVECSTRNTNIYRDFVKSNSEDPENPNLFLLKKEKDEMLELANTLMDNKDISSIITKADCYEEPMIGQIEGLWFKGKGDVVSYDSGFVDDLKTTSDITKFDSSVVSYFYDSSAYIYRELFDLDVRFIVIDKKTKRIGLYNVSDATYARGREKVLMAIEQYYKYYGEYPTHDITQYYHVGEV